MGFEISIDSIDCAFKLSQNRAKIDFDNIIKELRLSKNIGSKLMADAMERQKDISI